MGLTFKIQIINMTYDQITELLAKKFSKHQKEIEKLIGAIAKKLKKNEDDIEFVHKIIAQLNKEAKSKLSDSPKNKAKQAEIERLVKEAIRIAQEAQREVEAIPTPVDGVDGLNGRLGPQGPKGEKGDRGPKGDTSKDGSPDTPEQIRDKLQSLTGEERLDAYAIKNIPDNKGKWFGLANDSGGGGTSGEWSINEVPSGIINGSNTIFTTAHNFVSGTTQIYWNGLRQIITYSYSETGANQITFTDAPRSGTILMIDYIKG